MSADVPARRGATGSQLVPRPALAQRIGLGLDAGAVVLEAGPGFGKTLALEETLAARGGAAAWLRCAPAHRDAGRLLEYAVAALREAAPGVADVLGERLAGGLGPVDVEQASRILALELEALLADPLVVVFDDAEALDGAPSALRVVGDLLGARAPALRVAVATRRPLPLHAAKLAAADRLTVLGPADLAFSAQECAALMRVRSGREPTETEVEEVWTATEGWPLAVGLAARPRDRAPLRMTEPRALVAFIDEEVLGPLPPPVRDALVDSSVAPELDPGLLAALGAPDGMLGELAAQGLPLRRLEPGGERVDHHPFLRDFLRDRFRSGRPAERRREVHARCAEWLEQAGRRAEAVDHWLEAGEPDRAASVVVKQGPQLARTAPQTVAGWLERLPDEHRRRPALQLLHGRLAAADGTFTGALAPLRAAVEGFAAEGDEQSTWWAKLALGDALTIAEQFDAVPPLVEGYRDARVPPAPMVAISGAAALAGAGRFREASQLFGEAVTHPLGAGLEAFAWGFHGFWVDLHCGRLDAAAGALREAVRGLEREDPFDRLPFVAGMLGVVHEERGEEADALAAMDLARRAADAVAVGGYVGDLAHRFVAGVHARAGRLVEAERELEGLGPAQPGWYSGDAELTRATIAAGRGRDAEALDWAEQALAATATAPWRTRWRNGTRLVPVLAAAGARGRAAELVGETLAARPPLASCARLLALRGWLRALDGDEAGAVGDLRLAWEEAGGEPQHLVRAEWPRLESLLWTAVERGALDAEPVAAGVEAAFPGGAALLAFTRHPVAAMRCAAVASVASSGHPEAVPRVAALERDPEADVAAAARTARAHLTETPPPLAFSVLGRFALRRGAYAVEDAAWGSRRRAAQRLVRYLIAHRGSPVHEEALFAAFWPDVSADAARRSLQVTLSSARAVLDTEGAGQSRIVAADRTYRLELTSRDVVDAEEYAQTARRALAAGGPERARLLEAATARWTGDPMPEERYDDWATEWRERLVDLHRRVLGALVEAREASGDVGGAIDGARRLVELDALDEAAHRRLMLAYARSGRRGPALRQYLACRRALVGELGVEPSVETTTLQRRVLAGEVV